MIIPLILAEGDACQPVLFVVNDMSMMSTLQDVFV